MLSDRPMDLIDLMICTTIISAWYLLGFIFFTILIDHNSKLAIVIACCFVAKYWSSIY